MRIVSYLVFLVFVSACSQESAGDSAAVYEAPVLEMEPSNSYESAHAAAVAKIEEAGAKGHAWSTSDQLIKDAASAAANGDEATAIELADEARWQAQLAIIQADREALVWRDNVISD